jgi:hypothetical protein
VLMICKLLGLGGRRQAVWLFRHGVTLRFDMATEVR